MNVYKPAYEYKYQPEPEIIAGSPVGTIFENDPMMAYVKEFGTILSLRNFLEHNNWSGADSDCLDPRNDDKNWDIVYGLAKSFPEFDVCYQFRVKAEYFSQGCFDNLPQNMAKILKHGYLDAIVKWANYGEHLEFFAEVYEPEIYGDSPGGKPLCYFEGLLNSKGLPIAPLLLKADLNKRYP